MEERWIDSAFVNIERDVCNAKNLYDWEQVAISFENIAASILFVCKTEKNYSCIFDDIHSRAIAGFNSASILLSNRRRNQSPLQNQFGDVVMATAMYAENVIVVDMDTNNRYYGVDHIRQAITDNIEKGYTIMCKAARKIFHEAGENRFSAYIEFESTNLTTGQVTEGFFQQLYHKNEGQWKCVFEHNGINNE